MGNMTHGEFVWTMTGATFLAVILISILGFYITQAASRNWGLHLLVDRRCSRRFNVALPVVVYGHQDNAEPFFEDTTVLQVSPQGGLLTLTSRVRIGQELLLGSNGGREIYQPCRVARLGPSGGLWTEVAVRFERPAPEFWLTAQQADHAQSTQQDMVARSG
jgi:hypothetical protein